MAKKPLDWTRNGTIPPSVMVAPQLLQVSEEATRLARDILGVEAGRNALWHVPGPPTSGKTALLAQLGKSLSEQGLATVTVAPPLGSIDVAGLALLEIGTGLGRAGLINGELDLLVGTEESWAWKCGKIRTWLTDPNICNRLVLLCDEPDQWHFAVDRDNGPLAHVDDVVQLVTREAVCRRVITGRGLGVLSKRSVTLTRATQTRGWLDASQAWGPLAPTAAALFELARDVLERRSPLEVRLIIALASFQGAKAVVRDLEEQPRRRLADRLGAVLRAKNSALLAVWDRLALVRRPFELGLADRLGADTLSEIDAAILANCLLYQSDVGSWVLHDILRHDALRAHRLKEADVESAHAIVAEYYAELFTSAKVKGDSTTALLLEAEGFHHASRSGVDTQDRFRPFFGDQLDSWGRTISLKARARTAGEAKERLYAQAVTIFERALRWDDDDDYAHHYVGYNLDVVGREVERVEEEYRRAIDLNPLRAWYHSRLVCLLITLSRHGDAAQAWNEALDALAAAAGRYSEEPYTELHLWVARLLLHRGRLQFAREVLDDVPNEVAAGHEGFRALKHRLEALDVARKHGALVPGPYLAEGWWKRGPFLLEASMPSGERLVRWSAGRVDEVQGKEFLLRVGVIEASAPEAPNLAELRLTFAEFSSKTSDAKPAEIGPGTFVEFGVYATGRKGVAKERIRVHRGLVWKDDALPRLFPPPTRFLER